MNLADRIEAATGPDRELDAEIAKSAGWRVLYDDPDPNVREPYYQPVPEQSWTAVPRYTASLDAAMMLVGKDWYVEIKGPRRYLNIPAPVPNHWSANLETWNHEGQKMGWGATPALALAAAAIRAKGTDDGDV